MKTFDGGLFDTRDQTIVMGIDQSLTGFGLCLLSRSGDAHMTWVYKSPERGVDRLIDIQNWMADRFDEAASRDLLIVDSAMESGVQMSNSALVLGELSAAVKLLLVSSAGLGIMARRPLQVPPTSLKKFTTGKGNANKEAMVLSAYKHWGIDMNDNNAVDAYCLARLAAGGHSLTYQRETYDKLASDPKFRDQRLEHVLARTDPSGGG